MDAATFEKLVSFRKKLHKNPELSGKEENTSQMILNFIKGYKPNEIIECIGGAGLAFIYNGAKKGDILMLRADLDALPIQEVNHFSHKSEIEGVSHKCGHDGHMTILAGLATKLENQKIEKGQLVLLFQPAEETGEGAKRVIEDEKFKNIIPDYVFALHNLPGFPEHSIAIKDNHMTIASTGMKISLLGKTAHAMSPEDGISPIEAIKNIHTQIQALHNTDRGLENFSLITTVGINIGSEDYGVAPANGDIFLTVRAYKNEVLEVLLENITNIANEVAQVENLQMTVSYQDTFLASVNDKKCTDIVKVAAQKNQLPLIALEQGLGASEDFGRLIDAANKGGAIFLLGAGEDWHQIHTPAYDFNDNIIIDGVNMFYSIVEDVLGFQDLNENAT